MGITADRRRQSADYIQRNSEEEYPFSADEFGHLATGEHGYQIAPKVGTQHHSLSVWGPYEWSVTNWLGIIALQVEFEERFYMK